MSTVLHRRTFLRGVGILAGGVALSGPLEALAARVAAGAPVSGVGYGPLVDKGDLFLPEDFVYRVISAQGDPMSDGSPTPSRFDGMIAIDANHGTTVLIRNHENKRRFNMQGTAIVSPENEIDVDVPAELRYDPNEMWNGGVTRLEVRGRKVRDSRAVLGGTTHNCAGGPTPWGTWITCEELSQPPPGPAPGITSLRHGYIFEVDAFTDEPQAAVPIVAAGRCEHEAVAWLDGALYETEDRPAASLYRFVPSRQPSAYGDLAANGGILQALVVTDHAGLDTRTATGWPGGVGTAHAIDWVTIANPDPVSDMGAASIRMQAQAQGAAIFARTEGCWATDNTVLFDCTTGGGTLTMPPNGNGQVFELDPHEGTLTLVYQSAPINPALKMPDNLVIAPRTGDLFLCEDNMENNHIRGLTVDGLIFDFARAKSNPTEFCGACFDGNGNTLYVNQQGSQEVPGVTYAIWGPWTRQHDR
jgi:secreted PhoX family phosphatase